MVTNHLSTTDACGCGCGFFCCEQCPIWGAQGEFLCKKQLRSAKCKVQSACACFGQLGGGGANRWMEAIGALLGMGLELSGSHLLSLWT